MDAALTEWSTVKNLHIAANSFLSFLYLGVFISVIKRLITKPATRNLFITSIALFSVLVSTIFFFQAFFSDPWRIPEFEWGFLIIAILPAAIYFRWRGQAYAFIGEQSVNSSARFDKLKDEFLTVASHELRTPLSVINGFAEILVREKLGPLNDEQKRRVRKILMQAQRLNRIIDELLDLSRIRSGKIEVRKDIFDLMPVLKACIDDHTIVCEQQKLQLTDAIPDILPDVVGDLERVTQIIVNLLNNAIKYTEPGGSIRLTAFFDKSKNFVRVEVQDTGIGIDKDDQQNIFKEFYRASQHHARKYSGSGLGLAIVKQLVEVQKGRVGVQSEGLGKGSIFFFTLPVAHKVTPHGSVPVAAIPAEVPKNATKVQ